MKFHEIIPGLIAGKKYCCKNQKYLYQYIYHDGNDEILWSNDTFVPKDMITTSLYNTTVEWEEYKEYAKDLDFVEAYRLAFYEDAIIKSYSDPYYTYACDENGRFCKWKNSDQSLGAPLVIAKNILDKWHVVGYKGEWNEV